MTTAATAAAASSAAAVAAAAVEAAAKSGKGTRGRIRTSILSYTGSASTTAACAMSMSSPGAFLRWQMSRDSLNSAEACYELS